MRGGDRDRGGPAGQQVGYLRLGLGERDFKSVTLKELLLLFS